MLVLVRHAHAGDKRRWTGPDALRPLSRRGREEADGVAGLLAGLGVRRLLSSPALRCRQTLAPASELLGLAVEESEALAVGAPAEGLVELLRSPPAEGAALCTHGENLSALARAWGAEVEVVGGPDGGGLAGTPKGAAWVVERRGPRVTARYVPASRSGRGARVA